MAKRPSKGILFFAWSLIIVSLIQLFYMPAVLSEFGFLSRPMRIVSVGYMIVFNCAAVYTALSALCLKQWSRGALIILAVIGICDKAVFTPLRLRAVDRVIADPGLSFVMISEYRALLEKTKPAVRVSDDVLLSRIRDDLRQAQKAIEALWVLYLFVLAVFFLQLKVRDQFIAKEGV